MRTILDAVRLSFLLAAERMVRLPMHARLRPLLLKSLGARIGRKVRIDEVTFINLSVGFRNLVVGDEAYIGAGTLIDLIGTVEIGAHTAISPRCVLMTHADPGSSFGNRLTHLYPRRVAGIRIGSHSWIGCNTTILHGVTVGDHVVIGAAALVNRDVAAGQVAYGVPAVPQHTLDLAQRC